MELETGHARGEWGVFLVTSHAGRRRSGAGFVAVLAIVAAYALFPRPAVAGYAAHVVDAHTGAVLHSENADVHNYPASLAKMMTLYLVFESLDHGVIGFHTALPVSARAAARPPSKIGLRAGTRIALRDAIRTLATKSANDVATVVAEYFSGSEDRFARLMTARARALGMTQTTFRNASGLPDTRQRTTARDMVTLALALYERFPHYAHFFAGHSVTWRGKRYRNTNRLLTSYPGMDGIKTGYIRASGFNLAASARRDGTHIVAVVMGGKTAKRRDARVRELLDRAFSRATTQASDRWLIQVGVFSRRAAAESALDDAHRAIPNLRAAGERRIEPISGNRGTLYRARHYGLTKIEAHNACAELKRRTRDCLVVMKT